MEGALSLIALVAVVVSAGAITVAAHFRKERVTELKGWAGEHGWHYTERHPRPLEEATLPPDLLGRDPRVQHVLTGRRGAHLVTMFELTHSSSTATRRGTGRTRHTHRVVAVHTPGPGADLEIRRRDLARTVSLDGRGGPEEVGQAFAEAFHTVGSDDRFTRAVLDHDTVSWLLSDSRSRSLPARFTGGHVMTWAAMRLAPDRALTAADYLIELVIRVPDQAWERDATGPRRAPPHVSVSTSRLDVPTPERAVLPRGADKIRLAPTHKEYLMSDPNATHRISRADLFRDDDEETTTDPNATAQISREDLFKDEKDDKSPREQG